MAGLKKWVVIASAGLFVAGLFFACNNGGHETPDATVETNGNDEIDKRERVPVSADLAAFNEPYDWEIDDVIPVVISDTLRLELIINNKSNPLRDLVSYTGSVTGDADGDFTISRDGDRFLGNISLYAINKHFTIVHKPADNAHSVYQLVHPEKEENE